MKPMIALICAATVTATSAWADGHGGWSSIADQSRVAFGSVKSNEIGEVHHFNDVSGTVGADGAVEVAIGLGSVETNIDIRNERMIEHVFQGSAAKAMLAGSVDMSTVDSLEVGGTAITEFDGALTFAGAEVDVYGDMLVARLAENKVLVTTADFIMLSTDDLGITAGIDKLMELAGLPGITRVTPVSIRMVFEK